MSQTYRWNKDEDITQNLYQSGSQQEVDDTLKMGLLESEGY